MAAATYYDQVQLLYIAYFGRPADPVGLAYWAANVDAANGSLAGVIAGFSSSAESNALFGTLPTAQKVSAIYLNLFNRQPEASGLAYWVNQIESGAVTQAQAAWQIESQAGSGDSTSVANKLAMAKAFTAQIDTAPEVAGYNGTGPAAYGRAYLKGVDATPGSLSIATSILVDSVATATGVTPGTSGTSGTPSTPTVPSVATTFTLTTGADAFTGSPQDDIFNGTLGTGATYNTATDTLDGGAGNDTLNLISSGNLSPYTIDGTKVSNIEKLAYTANDSAATTLSLTGTSFSELVNSQSTVGTTFNGFGSSVTRLGISNVSGTSTTFNAAGPALTGNADALTLTLNTVAAAAAVTITATASKAGNEYETLNIVSNGTANSITLGTDATQTSLSTINISGSASLNLAFAGSGDTITTTATTIDAHTATGGVTIGSFNAGLGAANHTVTLGTGANVVFFGRLSGSPFTGYLNASDKVDGSLGNNDTLVVTGSGVTSADLVGVTGIETMRFMNTNGTLTQDASQLAVGTALQIDGTDSIVSFTNLANNTTVEVLGGWNLKMALAANTGADTLTVSLAPATTAGTTLATLTDVTGLETLKLVSNAAIGQTGANVITTDLVTANQVLTGSGSLTITNAISSNSFDASAFTGNLTITGKASTATTIKGGHGNDSITLGTGGDTVDAGAGNDTIYLGALGTTSHVSRGGDSIVTGTGNDTVVYVDNAGGGNGGANYAGQPSIIDFTVGPSALTTDLLGFSGANASFQLTPTGGSASTGLAKGAIAQGLTAGDAMVVQALSTTDGAAVASANASFFKLTTTTSFSTDNATTFANAIGAASITGLAANGNYVISLYDSGVGRAVIAVVNTGGSGNNDTTLSAADMTSADIAVVGIITMTAGDYANFGAAQLAAVF